MKLIDAARCPYCARVRIALAEKGLEHEAVVIDLSDRPRWVIDLNPPRGRVPILDDGFILPESDVIMTYLDERYPEAPLLPADRRGACAGAPARVPLRREPRRRLLRVPARRRQRPGRQAGGTRGGAEPVRGCGLCPLGDPRARHARRRAARADRGVAGGARAASLDCCRSGDRQGRCDRDSDRGAGRRGSGRSRSSTCGRRRSTTERSVSRATRGRATSRARETSTSTS